jgi:hypothetical protein
MSGHENAKESEKKAMIQDLEDFISKIKTDEIHGFVFIGFSEKGEHYRQVGLNHREIAGASTLVQSQAIRAVIRSTHGDLKK